MATYYPSSSSQSDVLPTSYLSSQKPDPCHESPHLSDNVHLNQASAAASYLELLSESSLSPPNFVEIPSPGGRGEMVFIPPTGDPISTQTIGGLLNMTTGVPVEQNLQCQGLSLSLGMQLPSSIHLPLFQYHYTNPGPFYLLSSHVPESGDRDCQNKDVRNDDYFSIDLAGGTHNTIKVGAVYNPQCSINPKGLQSVLHLYEPSGLASTIFNSKYLKAAHRLLNEVVNVHEALKKPKSEKHHNFHQLGSDDPKETDLKYNCHSVLPSVNGMYSDPHESTTNSSGELSPTERQDLKSKVTKLLSMLDEVDRRYRQYYHQMQTVESSFEMVTGCGAAKQYTALALQTISRHFRCLRDAINQQIGVTRQSLGEQDDTPSGRVLPRLRYVDKHLRQKRNLQQLGVMRHPWRPQRGLPESSVLILRAWLFEHFLHPYPKESEKIRLARQTGLTRSQVANWFINARVRLWKPMVEDMYKEEFGDSEAECKSSPEHTPKAARDKSEVSGDRSGELWGSGTSTTANGGNTWQLCDMKPNLIPDKEMNGCTARLGFHNGAHGDDNSDCGVMNLQGDRSSNTDGHSVCREDIDNQSDWRWESYGI